MSKEKRHTFVCRLSSQSSFQSAHPHEVRLRYPCVIATIHSFQSAHLREVRCSQQSREYETRCFNPRTCKRCDHDAKQDRYNDLAFQSAHLQEVRWQHIVKFTKSEGLPLHTDYKIDIIYGIRSNLRFLAPVLSERKRVDFMLT